MDKDSIVQELISQGNEDIFSLQSVAVLLSGSVEHLGPHESVWMVPEVSCSTGG